MNRDDKAIIAAQQQAILDAQDRIRLDKLVTFDTFYAEFGGTRGAFIEKKNGRYEVAVWDGEVGEFRKAMYDNLREALDVALDEDLSAIKEASAK